MVDNTACQRAVHQILMLLDHAPDKQSAPSAVREMMRLDRCNHLFQDRSAAKLTCSRLEFKHDLPSTTLDNINQYKATAEDQLLAHAVLLKHQNSLRKNLWSALDAKHQLEYYCERSQRK